MSPDRFLFSSVIPAPAKQVFEWHKAPDAIERLIPPWEPAKVIERTGDIKTPGARVVFQMMLFGWVPMRWVAEHIEYQEGAFFRDCQRSGPFRSWLHTHRVRPVDHRQCILEDEVYYELPFAPISHWIAGSLVRSRLKRMFQYRHEVVLKAFQANREDTNPLDARELAG